MSGGRLPRKRRLPLATGNVEYVLSGCGAATVVLLNGAGVTLEGWSRLYPEIESLGRVVAWNRFGAGASSAPRGPQDAAHVISAARKILRRLALPPPYVLVGHSLGGLHAQLFARRHSGEVAGLVLVEATHARDRDLLRGHEDRLAKSLRKLLGVPQAVFRPNLHAELEAVDAAAREVEEAGPMPSIPVVVVSGGREPPPSLVGPAALRIRRRHQKELARLSPLGTHAVARRSGHFPQITQPRLVLDAIASVVEGAAP